MEEFIPTMDQFSRKVKEIFHKVEDRVQEATPCLNQRVSEIRGYLEQESKEVIAYLNNEVVPSIRSHSGSALRIAAEKLSQLADSFDRKFSV